MSNKDKEMQNQNDSFESLFQGIGDGMLPPKKLEQAVIEDSYYQGIAYAGAHVRKITGAIVAYAVCVMLLLGALMLLPRLLDEHSPVATEPQESTVTTEPPSTEEPSESLVSPNELLSFVLSKSNVTLICRAAEQSDDGNLLEETVRLYRNENLVYQKTEFAETSEEEYFDTQTSASYYRAKDGTWMKDTWQTVSWPTILDELEIATLFLDELYQLEDEVYTISLSGQSIIWGWAGTPPEGLVWTYTQQNDVYLFHVAISDDSGTVISELSLEITFDTAPAIELPAARTCNHEYAPTDENQEPTCAGQYEVYYICTKCGHEYNVWYDPIDHIYLNSVCIVCGAKCDRHVYVENGSTIYSCTDGQTISYSCKNCYDGYSEYIPGTGAHKFENGRCVGCTIDCEHDYENHECTMCGNICYHEFKGKSCTICGVWCEHQYKDSYCAKCDSSCSHEWETTVSWASTCTEGKVTTTACKYCGYNRSETTLAQGHVFENGNCKICKKKQTIVTVTDPNVTPGAECLLPQEVYQIYDEFDYDYYCTDPVGSFPIYYNVYTYFAGCTVTDIRLPVCWAEKGSVFTIRVVKTENGYQKGVVDTYQLVADRDMEKEWVLFSGLSIEVPEDCTLAFGWMSDTMCIARPADGFINGYCAWNDYAGSCGLTPLLMDVYGKKN